MDNKKIIDLDIVKRAKLLAINNYKNAIINEYNKYGINYSGNIDDMIEKVRVKQVNSYFFIIIYGGNYSDYFKNKGDKIIFVNYFNKNGSIIYRQNNINDDAKIFTINNNVYIFKDNNRIIHYNCNNDLPIINSINEKIEDKNLYFTDYSSSLVCFMKENDEYLVYNQDKGTPLFICNNMTNVYPEYSNIDKGNILVRKRITFEDLYSDIEFFVDKDGNIISPIVDCTYGVIHNNYNHVGSDFTFNIVKIFLKQEYDKMLIRKSTVKQLKKSLMQKK